MLDIPVLGNVGCMSFPRTAQRMFLEGVGVDILPGRGKKTTKNQKLNAFKQTFFFIF